MQVAKRTVDGIAGAKQASGNDGRQPPGEVETPVSVGVADGTVGPEQRRAPARRRGHGPGLRRDGRQRRRSRAGTGNEGDRGAGTVAAAVSGGTVAGIGGAEQGADKEALLAAGEDTTRSSGIGPDARALIRDLLNELLNP